MKRVGDLWTALTRWDNLLECVRLAARGKRRRSPAVARFLHEMEGNLCRLQRELREGSYRPGAYRTFRIYDPKERCIAAAPFRDRVVHHALTRALEPVWEPRFSAYSFASRAGKGQHAALAVAAAACAQQQYVLKGDVRRYFPSIDHAILQTLLRRAVKCEPTLRLAGLILDGWQEPESAPAVEYFAGDDLFSPAERRRGLPIGNQTSQFFANVYLNPLDHYVYRQEKPGPGAYLRYVDDFLLFGDSREELLRAAGRIRDFLGAELRLRVHEGKFQVRRCADGVTFLGWRLFPGRRRLARGNVVRIRRRLRHLREQYHAGLVDAGEFRQVVQGWLGHAAAGNTWRLRQQLFDELILVPAEHGRTLAGRVLEQQYRVPLCRVCGAPPGGKPPGGGPEPDPSRRVRACQLRFRAVIRARPAPRRQRRIQTG
ncbi:MAG: reverse transcriptase domain-containing protein [Acidobacteriota bacterium]